ncbi:hypothetical protein [Marinagarivorans algicola]|uniref:hypothetical protein n=1 Tax=Marinagarivorans algicola TaxID=1513270 RepID=UPI003736D648
MRNKIVTIFKGCMCLGLAVIVSIFGPAKVSHHLDAFWVEEAHHALLSGLVEARKHAWENRVTVELCAATAARVCITSEDSDIEGWLMYEVGPERQRTSIQFYSFHAEYVGLTASDRFARYTPLGFDADGYSVQANVIGFDVYSLSGVSTKNYTILVEPSGALQTLVNGTLRSNRQIAQR